METGTTFVLAVALITWGGVFAYLLRLSVLTRELEKKIERDVIERDVIERDEAEDTELEK